MVHLLDLSNPDKPSCDILATLQRSRRADGFSVAIYKDELVFLTGGFLANKRAVSIYSIAQDRWAKGPSLNSERYQHSSVCSAQRVFVIGGPFMNSIESLHAELQDRWCVIGVKLELLNLRSFPALAEINSNLIAVFGGLGNWGNNLSDGFLFYTNSNTLKPILGSKDFVKFHCRNPVRKDGPHKFITVGKDSYSSWYMIELTTNFDFTQFETRSIKVCSHDVCSDESPQEALNK